MATTLEQFANTKRGNYCDLPSIDVEILPSVHHCKKCGEEISYDPKGGKYGWGEWSHVNEPAEAHHTGPRDWCYYCHNDDPASVRYVAHAWFDATECDRCGGVDGRALGD